MQPVTIEDARIWYQEADPVHDFDHVLRVYRVAERLAKAEGADWRSSGRLPSCMTQKAAHPAVKARNAPNITSLQLSSRVKCSLKRLAGGKDQGRPTLHPGPPLSGQKGFA